MKTCFKCGAEKPVEAFYRHPKMSDGRLNKCIECTKSDVRSNRAAKVHYYREYDRKRANVAGRPEARAAYAKTGAGKKTMRKARDSYSERHPQKRSATVILRNAVRDGRVTRQPCEVCGTTRRLQAHHDDYSKPLEVRWLCVTHHAARHKQLREIERMKQITDGVA